jgi:hypothetical protein
MPHKDPEVRRRYQREYARRWRLLHPELSRQKSLRSYYKHREERVRKKIEYLKKNPVLKRLLDTRQRHRTKLKVIQLLGGKCARCGVSDPRVLQVHHRNGGGNVERREKGDKASGYKFYSAIIHGERPIDDLELLCANCNILAEYERGKRFWFPQLKERELKELAYQKKYPN